MAQIPLIDAAQAPLLVRQYFENGDPGPIVSALAHVPEFLEAAMPFLGAVLGPSALDERTKELIILRASAVAGCSYCTGTHSVVALDLGLEPDEVRALRGEAPIETTFANDAERAVVAWTDTVAGASGAHKERARDELRVYFDDADVVEMTTIAATTLMLTHLCSALDLPISDENTRRLREAGMS